MRRGYKHRRNAFLPVVDDCLKDSSVKISDSLRTFMQQWAQLRHENRHDMLLGRGKSVYHQLYQKIVPLLEEERHSHVKLQKLYDERDMFTRFSHWIVGGDGWAYDIGFGGLDHVLASEEHVRVLVLDTEMYSNTGGQASKATPAGAQVKFAETGKETAKKDLGRYAMTHRNVYVASISIHANHQQAVRALLEAEAYPGPAIIVCYCPCIAHGYGLADALEHCRKAVETGYWPLYRFNPQNRLSGNNPFQLDSKKITGNLLQFLQEENRYASVMRMAPAHAKELDSKLQGHITETNRLLKSLLESESGEGKDAAAAGSSSGVTILYGSETGNAQELATALRGDLVARGSKGTQLSSLDDFEFADLPKQSTLIIVCSTCGLGEFPANARQMWKKLADPTLGMQFLAGVKYAVFGLGDSGYSQFCAAAAAFDMRLQELGATRIMTRGTGDDKAEDKYYSGWESWTPQLWPRLELPNRPVKQERLRSPLNVTVSPGGAVAAAKITSLAPPGFTVVPRVAHRLLTPKGYDRDIRHYEFDIRGTGLKYNCGDALAVFPHNDPKLVEEFCRFLKLDAKSELNVAAKPGENAPWIPTELSIGQLFGCVLDVFGKPNKKFYELLAPFATNPKEREELSLIGCEEGKGKFRELQERMVTYAEVLELYPSARPELEHLMVMVPRIRPRLYSISSDHGMHPDKIHLTVVEVNWEVERNGAKKARFGQCTSYLKSTTEKEFAVQVTKSAIKTPTDESIPLILVGMGTGLAPWRGLSQHRVHLHKQGKTAGPVRLYFGARKRSQEFLYENEFEEYAKSGVLTLRTAFSRDQAKKIYVQHRLEEDGEIIYKQMTQQGAYFYVCGSARQLPADIYAAMKKIVMRHGACSEVDAEAQLASWKLEGRYTVEAFS